MKITVIGAGNMGGAIAKGLYGGKHFKEQDITCTVTRASSVEALKAKMPQATILTDNAAAVKGADIVLFAVKPWLLQSVVEGVKSSLDYSKQLVISVAAGKDCAALADIFRKADGSVPSLVYLIPNTAVEVGAGVTLYTSENASKEQLALVQDIFSELGFARFLEGKQMSAGITLASCGIAYIMRYIRASVEGGVEMGFYPKDAQEIVLNTVKGAAELLLDHKTNPEQEIDRVTTPGGLAIKGLNAMEDAGFTAAVIAGLKAGRC